jgi:pimeloyl-ACP methyl ester carboxylesterase
MVQPSLPATRPSGFVFVADGAGDFRAASQALQEAVRAEGLALCVEPFVWSHGYLRILADQADLPYAHEQGRRLAEWVTACRQVYPDCPIYLVGHSAGCAVVLAAAETLPRGSLERVLLMAPSVPNDYDLRPTLHCVRQGVDVFCSPQDGFYLHVGTFLTGLTEGSLWVPAGCKGFLAQTQTKDDSICYYTKLTHYPWGPWLAWTGNDGGHFGAYQQGYLRAFILPLLTVPAPDETTGPAPGHLSSAER